MIGIQRDLVIGFNGKVKGELINNYYIGVQHTQQNTIEESIIIKKVEVYDDKPYPKGMTNILYCKKKGGTYSYPTTNSIHEGSLIGAKNEETLNLVLKHNGTGTASLRLVASNNSAFELCTWYDSDLAKSEPWSIVVSTFRVDLRSNSVSLQVASVISKDADQQWAKLKHLTVTLTYDSSSNGINLTLGIGQDDYPVLASQWGVLYTTTAQNCPADYQMTGYNSSGFVQLEDTESRSLIKEVQGSVDNVDRRLLGLEVSSNSRYVSR